MANIDLDKIVGTDQFPNKENDVYALIETIASQRIMAVQSANRLIDATFDYVVENGQVIQEAVIEMAKSYAYDKSAYDRAPKDPTLHVRYFADYTERQFEVTVRRDDVRKIIANKGEGVEDVIAQILATLTAGEGHEDFENVRALILNEYVPDYSAILGGVPKNIKGCIYAARNMYNHLKSDNSDLTEGAGTDDAYISSTPAADIRVAITESLLNLMDVVELANIFNLEKEELFGILVVVPDSDLDAADKYKIVVYDRKAMGRATFIYDFTQEEVAKGRFRNEYLTVSRAYFYNELFKAAALDCTVAATDAIGDLIQPPFDLTVTVTNGTAGGDTKIALGGKAEVTITPDSGYLAPEDETGFTLSHVEIDDYTVDENGVGHLTLVNADADCSVSCTCASEATFTALEVGDSISGGATIYVKKIDDDALRTLLVALAPSASVTLAKGSETYPDLYLGYNYGGAFRKLSYRSASGVLQDIVEINATSGPATWSVDIAEDGALVLDGSASGTIATLTGEGWNGVIIGKME